MCMLCVVPPHVIPSREKLENSALNNPHGFGFAIVIPSEQRIHAERTLNPDTSINRFLEMRGKYPEGYAMWHARFATHGSQTVDNCHPFRVGGDRKTYLAHNGILPMVEYTGDDRSDTRMFAEDLLPAIGGVKSLDNEQVWNMLEDFTQGSKVCILTVDPQAQHQMYLLHENKGYKDTSGVWWSNDSCYLDYTIGYGAKNKWTSDKPLSDFFDKDPGSNDFIECKVCDMYVDYHEAKAENMLDFCASCGSCYGCEVFISDCLCLTEDKKDEAVKAMHASATKSWGWSTW